MKSDISAGVVPFYDYGALHRTRGRLLRDAIDDVLDRGAFIMQAEVADFELKLSELLGQGEVIGVGNCTDGLELVLRSLEIGHGDEVILPAHTFVATAGAVKSCGATPRFAEVGPGRDLDYRDIARLASATTRAVIPVSLNGRCADLDLIVQLATSHGWHVVEDAAQAAGATIEGRAAGTWGTAGSFSFYPAKTLGAAGDAGAIVTTHPDLAERLRAMRDHGRLPSGEVAMWGRNSRLDNLQAAVLLVQLDHYEADTARRREIFANYLSELADIDSIVLPCLDERGRRDICQNFEVWVPDRAAFKQGLADQGVGTAFPWGGKAVTDYPALRTVDETPYTSELLEHLVLLPLHQYLTDDDVDAVVRAVKAVVS